MLFALTDKSLVIDEKHLRAALAWVRYGVDAVKFVFAERTGMSAAVETENDARKILEYLKERPEDATLTDIGNEVFQKKASAGRLNNALKLLLTANPPRVAAISRPRCDGKPGKPKQVYRAISTKPAELADLAEIEQPRGFEASGISRGLSGFSFLDAAHNGPNSANSENGSKPCHKPNSAISANSDAAERKSDVGLPERTNWAVF